MNGRTKRPGQAQEAASGPLTGLRVLDFGQYIAGPMAAVFLADQGADVIAVDPPGGPRWDHPAAAGLARGKRRIELDLTTADGLATAHRLVDGADIVVENFRPGVMARLGLGYDALSQRNPGVILVSMPGFGRYDERSYMPGWDGVIGAACGLFTNLSTVGSVLGLPPVFTALPIPSVYAAVHGAIAAVAGVHGRDRNGHGDWIEVPLLDAAMSAAAGYLLRVTDQPARYNEPPLPSALLDRLDLHRLPRWLSRALEVRARALFPPFFRNYRTNDGRHLFLCAIDHERHIDRTLTALDLGERSRALGFVRGDALDIPATKTNIYAYRSHPRWNRLSAAIQRRLGKRSALEAEDVLGSCGVPVGMQRTTSEWTAMPEMRRTGVVIATEDGVQPGLQIDVVGRVETGADVVATESPSSGSAAVDDVSWDSPAQPFAMKSGSVSQQATAPLAGTTVLDMANVIAGPVAARTLAELGATVTHVDPVSPTMGPRLLLHIGIEVNQGKRSVAMDPTEPDGREVLESLIRSSDVVVYNKTEQQARRLGVSPEDVHRLNDRAVVCAITAWGGSSPGEWDERPGYDPVVQAVSGVMSRFGGPEHPAVHGVAATIDYFTGFSGAYAAIVGLLARRRGGRDLTVRTSLVRSAGWVQLPFVTGRDVPEPSGHATLGWHAADRMYKTRDGWIHVSALPSAWPQIRDGLRSHVANATDVTWSDADRTLERLFAQHPTSRSLAIALGAGFAAHDVVNARAMTRGAHSGRFDGTVVTPELASGRVVSAQHPSGTSVVLPDSTWNRPLRSPRRRLTPAPSPGADTADIVRAAAPGRDHTGSSAFSKAWFNPAEGYLPT
ncbi:CoA transferase [Rhodococcus sp. SORGH_AS_0301]|uniref:CoA transferase n=1 Tax=Rhodococcus sp. SORGH_AS_0301 TaxID=3041780 RepID=UPI00277DB6B7|nr:CoA transferase [Rhodococcus sp. SORGH_AS_0301]MDQ1181812.1 crotonobetainyl-CoA:carnitine CoA-transferase CaiB-like acyl-CoA transferase [Rhodococcus sp. SORGH_AS_0301]